MDVFNDYLCVINPLPDTRVLWGIKKYYRKKKNKEPCYILKFNKETKSTDFFTGNLKMQI